MNAEHSPFFVYQMKGFSGQREPHQQLAIPSNSCRGIKPIDIDESAPFEKGGLLEDRHAAVQVSAEIEGCRPDTPQYAIVLINDVTMRIDDVGFRVGPECRHCLADCAWQKRIVRIDIRANITGGLREAAV
jgi:hypothetical protein